MIQEEPMPESRGDKNTSYTFFSETDSTWLEVLMHFTNLSYSSFWMTMPFNKSSELKISAPEMTKVSRLWAADYQKFVFWMGGKYFYLSREEECRRSNLLRKRGLKDHLGSRRPSLQTSPFSPMAAISDRLKLQHARLVTRLFTRKQRILVLFILGEKTGSL